MKLHYKCRYLEHLKWSLAKRQYIQFDIQQSQMSRFVVSGRPQMKQTIFVDRKGLLCWPTWSVEIALLQSRLSSRFHRWSLQPEVRRLSQSKQTLSLRKLIIDWQAVEKILMRRRRERRGLVIHKSNSYFLRKVPD